MVVMCVERKVSVVAVAAVVAVVAVGCIRGRMPWSHAVVASEVASKEW